jgi:integrating conjugative element protein (TIGR03756 family)
MCLALAFTAQAREKITAAGIIADTIRGIPANLDWHIIGICYWLQCTPFECSIQQSVKVGHYNPDFVVSAYQSLEHYPWADMRPVIAALTAPGYQGQGVARTVARPEREHNNMVFKEADVIGHPLSSLTGLADVGLLCPAATQPLQPYFLSRLDGLAWRTGITDALYPQTYIPGMDEVAEHPPLQTWGSTYPRTGWLSQAEDPKAAAVMAQRAANIVTQHNQPHLYDPVDTGRTMRNDMLVWQPGEITADRKTGVYQMLVPEASVKGGPFGTDDTHALQSWSRGKVAKTGGYAWILWRPYKCCEEQGMYLGSIDFVDYP